MEPIQPNFPWQPCQTVRDIPEAELVYAIIVQAWQDANRRLNGPIRQRARAWFYTRYFSTLCNFLDLNYKTVREHGRKIWTNE